MSRGGGSTRPPPVLYDARGAVVGTGFELCYGLYLNPTHFLRAAPCKTHGVASQSSYEACANLDLPLSCLPYL